MTRPNAFLALSTVALLNASAAAADLLVPDQFATIQAAVDAALPGDKVRIADGVYDEGVMVQGKFDLAIKGDDGVFVRMIWVDSSTKVSVKEITYFEQNDYQLLVTTSNDVDVRFSTFQNGVAGVGAFDSQKVNVRDSDFLSLGLGVGYSNCQQSRIAAAFTGTEVAAHVVFGSSNLIEDCPLKNAGSMVVEQSPFTTVRANSFKNSNLGLVDTSGCLVEGNKFKKSAGAAIVLSGVVNSTIQGNSIKKPLGHGVLTTEGGGGCFLFANKVKKAMLNGVRLETAGNSLDQNVLKKSKHHDLFDATFGQNSFGQNAIGTSNL